MELLELESITEQKNLVEGLNSIFEQAEEDSANLKIRQLRSFSLRNRNKKEH